MGGITVYWPYYHQVIMCVTCVCLCTQTLFTASFALYMLKWWEQQTNSHMGDHRSTSSSTLFGEFSVAMALWSLPLNTSHWNIKFCMCDWCERVLRILSSSSRIKCAPGMKREWNLRTKKVLSLASCDLHIITDDKNSLFFILF